MTSSFQNNDKEACIRDFEKVLEEVRIRNGGSMQHLDRSAFPPQTHASRTPSSTEVICTSQLVSSASTTRLDHPLNPATPSNHGGNLPLNNPVHPPFTPAFSVHSTPAATAVYPSVPAFQGQLAATAKQQPTFSASSNYRPHMEPVIDRNIQSWTSSAGDSVFPRHSTPLYHPMQPRNYPCSSTSAPSSTQSPVFPGVKHHVEIHPGRSPDCQTSSDSSMPGDSEISGHQQDDRKARNRAAAMKCRAKKLEQIRRLEKRVTDLRNLNMVLQKQVAELRLEIQNLQYVCIQHRSSGCRI